MLTRRKEQFPNKRKKPKQKPERSLSGKELQAYRKFLAVVLPRVIEQHTKGYQIFDNIYSYESFKAKLEEKLAELLKKKENVTVLNIGAGRQHLEREIKSKLREAKIENRVKIVPIDILNSNDYSENSLSPLTVVADAIEMPFPDNKFDLVVSEMTIDILPFVALKESFRVLKPEGDIIFHFHWWSESGENAKGKIAEYIKKYSLGGGSSNEEEIKKRIEKAGFKNVKVDTQGFYDGTNETLWLEVTGKKLPVKIK